MSKKFFTNTDENTLINKFEGVFNDIPNIKNFDALVGYFRASGYFRVRPFLDKVPKIRILVGINVDKLLGDAQRDGLEFFKNHDKTKEEFILKIQEAKKRIIAIEIGAGKTIRTIRNAAESFASDTFPLIRINPFDAETKIANHISVQMSAKDFLMFI